MTESAKRMDDKECEPKGASKRDGKFGGGASGTRPTGRYTASFWGALC